MTGEEERPTVVEGASGGTFSYQGRLTDAGAPVTGAADLRFRLYDASAGGNQVGSQITDTNVTVTGGLFNV